jgi:hypothetical protein
MRRKYNGTKNDTEAMESKRIGRGAFHMGRRLTERTAGLYGRENAGMSNEKAGENPARRKPKDS